MKKEENDKRAGYFLTADTQSKQKPLLHVHVSTFLYRSGSTLATAKRYHELYFV